MPSPKSQASLEVLETARLVEESADLSYKSLALLGTPSNVGIWALLAESIVRLEQAAENFGEHSKDLSAALVNTGRALPIALSWIAKSGKPRSALVRWHMAPHLRAKAGEALALADAYAVFCASFPMWHADRYLADVVSERVVRFTARGNARDRQVSAHLKGFQPTSGSWRREAPKPVQPTERELQMFATVIGTSQKAGARRFKYGEPWRLWTELLRGYRARVAGITRRPDHLSLGAYTLGDFKSFYAALLAICEAHDRLCFEWQRTTGSYPLDSAVLIHSAPNWIDIASSLSGVPRDRCRAIIDDLTFRFERSVDLHIHPFVPLDTSAYTLALVPKFPLHSLPDENILRVCSQLRPTLFDATSQEKESEILTALHRVHSAFRLQDRIALPNRLPDIDLIVSDEASSTVVFAEVKWIRKAVKASEYQARDAEIHKGIFKQLKDIRDFLTQNPEHLRSTGKLPRSLAEYRNVYYLLVARDHWVWIEPLDNVAIVEFMAFSRTLGASSGLDEAVKSLLTYDWLPVEGRDFSVTFDRVRIGSVAIELQVFYGRIPFRAFNAPK